MAQLHRSPHDVRLADDQRTTGRPYLLLRDGFDSDFGTYPCRVADSESQKRAKVRMAGHESLLKIG
jgi:hypothetical protein